MGKEGSSSRPGRLQRSDSDIRTKESSLCFVGSSWFPISHLIQCLLVLKWHPNESDSTSVMIIKKTESCLPDTEDNKGQLNATDAT